MHIEFEMCCRGARHKGKNCTQDFYVVVPSGVFGGRVWCDRPLWSDRELLPLDNFSTVFVSFVSQLKRKIRVSRLLVTVRVFCLLKTASKCTQTYNLGDKNDFFSVEGPSPIHNTPPPLTPTAPRPLLTEILNTPRPRVKLATLSL